MRIVSVVWSLGKRQVASSKLSGRFLWTIFVEVDDEAEGF